MGAELHHANDIMWHHVMSSARYGGVGCVIQGGVCHGKLPVWIFDQYFSVIVTIPHISIKTESLCIPTYFSVYLKPQEVIIMHKIHKYLKTFLSSRRRCLWCHTIMAGTHDGPRWPIPPLAHSLSARPPLSAHSPIGPSPPSAWPPWQPHTPKTT